MKFLTRVLMMACTFVLLFATMAQSQTQDEQAEPERWVFDFSEANDEWQMTDAAAWKFEEGRLRLFQKRSNYQPPYRSPLHIALLKEKEFHGFQLDVQIRSTHKDYDHRDVCLFFGYQGPDQFYYVHLGKKTDPHANQIFIVNQAARTKISTTTTDGTPWDDQWHHLRIIRDADSGDIRVYFDNMDSPAMTANDKTFPTGRIGLGSFDDTADFDDLKIVPLKKSE